MFNFNDIIGNKNIIKAMQGAIAGGRVSHAYIICGEKGSGKKLLANTFAKTLQCIRGGVNPCNECLSCKTFDSFSHADVIYVRPMKTKSLGVDDIREQIDADIKPFAAGYKIFIIEGEMTLQAQNALLKTLEEPPSYAKFIILVKDLSELAPTILSRCVCFKIRPVELRAVTEYLSNGANDDEVYFAAAYARGNVGLAKEILSSGDFKAMREMVTDALASMKAKALTDIFKLALSICEADLGEALGVAYLWYRDAVVYKETGGDARIIQRDILDKIKAYAEESTRYEIYSCLEYVSAAIANERKKANAQLNAEVMLLRIYMQSK